MTNKIFLLFTYCFRKKENIEDFEIQTRKKSFKDLRPSPIIIPDYKPKKKMTHITPTTQ